MLTENIDKLGALIRERRKSLKLTQTQLAEMAGVRVATISDLETGRQGTWPIAMACFANMGLLEIKAKKPFGDEDFEFVWDPHWKENFL